jgi:hypothetical protein
MPPRPGNYRRGARFSQFDRIDRPFGGLSGLPKSQTAQWAANRWTSDSTLIARIRPVPIAHWEYGCCASVLGSGTDGLITPKPRAKKNVFTARSKLWCSIAVQPGLIMSIAAAIRRLS